MEKKKKIEYWSKSTLLDRGWTEKTINELLPPPKLVDNPHYKCAGYMKLWEQKVVKQKERTKKFKESAEKKAKRRESSLKAVATKTEKTLSLLPTLSLEVERVDLKDLKKWTLNAKWNWYMYTGQDWRADSVDFADEETVLRWEINFIRHNLSNYDNELDKLYGKVGKTVVYSQYRNQLMSKIFEVYPELKAKIDELEQNNTENQKEIKEI